MFGATGETAEQMAVGLKYGSVTRKSISDCFRDLSARFRNTDGLKMATKLFVQQGYAIKLQFNQVVAQSFNSSAQNVNFANSDATARIINDWVSTQTNFKISDIVDPSAFDETTRMILVNAIYFKGTWVHQFDKQMTKQDKFYLNDVDTKTVDFMNIKVKEQKTKWLILQ